MNKFEFQEQIIDVQALIEEGRFQEAAEMADKLNLELLEEPRTLRQLARAYEKCGRYADAEILLMKAYDYAPRSRGILFSLCNTAIRAGNLEGAEGFYDDFCHLAPRDSQRYVIQYRLSVAKNRPDSEIIEILETLRADEPNDRWLYILAQYYAKNGRINDAVKALDEIDLWFDSGRYVERAAELKAYLTGTEVPEKKPASVSYTYTFTEEENQGGETGEAASEAAEKAEDVTGTETATEAAEKAETESAAETDTESDSENAGETDTETGTEPAEETEADTENAVEAAEKTGTETAEETAAEIVTETVENFDTETDTETAEEKDTETDTEIDEEIAPEIGTAFVAESVAETLEEIETSASEAVQEDLPEILSEADAEESADAFMDIPFESVYSVSKGEQLFETDESWIEDLTRGLYTIDPPRSEKPAVKEQPEETSEKAAEQEEEGPLSDEEVLVQLLDDVPEKKEEAEEVKDLLVEDEPEETGTAAEETASEEAAASEEEAEAEEDDKGFNGLLNRIARRKEEKDLFGGLPVDPEVSKRTWHFIILAENTELAEACARDLVKEIGEQNPSISLPKAKLKAAKIGNVSIIGALDHFLGRMTIVENASVLSDSQLDEFTKILDRDDRSLLIGFTDTRENIVKLFERMPSLAESFTAVFDGRERTPDDLLNIVQSYFYEADARLSADAEAVVLKKAADLLAVSRTSARREILHFAEQGLDKAEKGGFLGFGAGKVDNEGILTVAAKHFKGLE